MSSFHTFIFHLSDFFLPLSPPSLLRSYMFHKMFQPNFLSWCVSGKLPWCNNGLQVHYQRADQKGWQNKWRCWNHTICWLHLKHLARSKGKEMQEINSVEKDQITWIWCYEIVLCPTSHFSTSAFPTNVVAMWTRVESELRRLGNQRYVEPTYVFSTSPKDWYAWLPLSLSTGDSLSSYGFDLPGLSRGHMGPKGCPHEYLMLHGSQEYWVLMRQHW